MGKRRDPPPTSLRDRLIGLGERSLRKSYYPALRERVADLERFRTLFDASSDGVVLVEVPSGLVADLNEAGRRFLGGGESARPGVPLRDLLPPAARAPIEERLRADDRGAAQPFVLPLEAREGERFLELSIRSHGSFGGRSFAVLEIRDETDRARAEAALKASEERYRDLYESSADAIVAVDLEGRFTEANPAALALLGYTLEELRRLTYREITPPRWHAMNDALLRRAVRSGGSTSEYEKEYARKDGTVVPVSVRAFVRRDLAGQRAGVWAIVRDMTERKRGEEALRDSEERFRVTFHTSLDAIAITSIDGGVFVAVNEGFGRIFGYAEAEVMGRSSLAVGVWHDPGERARLVEGLRRGGDVRDFEATFRRKDGRLVPGSISAQIIRLRGEEYVLSITRDMTAWKRAAEERDRLKSALYQASKMEAIGQLAGGIAHDFNNLLTVILSGAEALKLDLASGSPPEAELVEEIAAAGDRARDLTRQLLTVARRQVIAPVPLDLNAAVRGSEKLLRRVLGEDVELAVELLPGLWTVRCDPGQIEQVVLNLAVNARDAMPGGGRLTLATANVEVDERLTASRPWMSNGAYARLSVQDTGHGMSPDVMTHVFEPFFTTKAVGRGTGLGLATVYGIVKQNGGYILVESEPGRGTTFELYFPRVLESAAEATAATSAAAPTGSETVLVVEDDPQVREVTVRALRAGGYRVLVARGAAEALDAVAPEHGPLHLLVTDVVMPGRDGRALADELRREHPDVRVLYVSGYPQEVIVKRGVIEPGIEFLPKPFTASTLLARVRAVLDGRTP